MFNASLTAQNTQLKGDVLQLEETIAQLKAQLDWFKRQLFGEKSEKRLLIDPAIQPGLFDGLVSPEEPIEIPTQTIPAHTRKTKSRHGCVNDSGLRFDDTVPVQVVEITPPELKGDQADDYKIIRYDETCLLAQRPGSYVIIKERRPVLMHQPTEAIINIAAPERVLPGSIADVSFLAGMLVDKFLYHLPLHRQHRRLQDAGIQLARSSLTHLVKRAIALLEPIAEAQFQHALQSKVLAIDETPIKAGRKGPGKLQQAYFWPIYGEESEVCFRFHENRQAKHLKTILGDFKGTLLSDGYDAYARYSEQKQGITHAQCWAHTRRYFERSLDSEPEAANEALQLIGQLYQHEAQIRNKTLTGDKKHHYRLTHSEPVVKLFWQWCEQQCRRHDLTPKSPLSKALKYAMNRTQELQVFLADPEVAIDTNHLERALRAIPMGRKNWLFCWTEAGARDVATIQSLLVTCRLQGVNPYIYLVDVLQRVSQHPDKKIIDLTPRKWQEQFADSPLKSVLDRE